MGSFRVFKAKVFCLDDKQLVWNLMLFSICLFVLPVAPVSSFRLLKLNVEPGPDSNSNTCYYFLRIYTLTQSLQSFRTERV